MCLNLAVLDLMVTIFFRNIRKKKGKVLPYSLPSVGPGADSGTQAVSSHVTF